MRLAHKDLQTILESVSILNSDASVSSLPTRLFSSVSNSLRSEIIAFDGWENLGCFRGRMWYEPSDWLTQELAGVFGAYANEHPLVTPIFVEKWPSAIKISDILTPQQFQRTGLFNEFFRIIGIEEQMSIPLDIAPSVSVTCTLNRDKRNFTERDRRMLDTLKPHLTNAVRNAQAFERLDREREYLNQIAAYGIIVLDREGNLKFVSEAAFRSLQKYFGRCETKKLPDDLRGFVETRLRLIKSREYFQPADLFCVKGENSELKVRLIFDLDSDELRLILEEKAEPSPGEFLGLGFTKREAEVLHWIRLGKTDEVIATLCGCSTRTIQKHVEHIRQKLNVETRNAAVRCALGMLDNSRALSRNII